MKQIKELRLEASVLRLFYTLITARVSISDALSLTAEKFQTYKILLLSIKDRLDDGVDMTESSEDQRLHFSNFVQPLLSLVGHRGKLLDKALCRATLMLDGTARMLQSGATEFQIGKVNFFRLLGHMIELDGGLLGAIEAAGKGYLSPRGINLIIKAVSDSGSLVSGLKANRELFADIDYSLMSLGEETMCVPNVCARLAEIHERQLLMMAKFPYLQPAADQIELGILAEFMSLAAYVDSTSSVNSGLQRVSITTIPCRRIALRAVKEKCLAGENPSDAMKSLPEFFPPYIVQMVRMGEVHGELELTFKRISNYLTWELLGIEKVLALEAVVA